MSLCPKKIIVLRRDDDSSGKNIVPSAEVSIKNTAGDLVTIYGDKYGYVTLSNPSPVSENGELEFWVEEGNYYAESSGSEPFFFDAVAIYAIQNEITEYGFSLSAVSDATPQDVTYTFSVGRNLGSRYIPRVELKGIGVVDDEEYFNVSLATEHYVDSAVSSYAEPVVTKSTSTFDLDSSEINSHIRCTYNGAKTMTIRPESTHPQPDDARYKITNRNLGDLSVTLGSGVTAVRAGSGSQYSTITVKYGSTLFLKRVAADTYDVEITSDNYGVGTSTSSLGGVSADYSDMLGCGFYSMPSSYDTGYGLLPSACPKIRVDQSSNLSAEFLSFLPTSSGADNGKLLYRDRTGAVWNDFRKFIFDDETTNTNADAVYDESVTVSGVTIRMRIWKGSKSKDAHILVDVSGTASAGISTTLTDVDSTLYPYTGEIVVPFYKRPSGIVTIVGGLFIDSFGNIAIQALNGTVFSSAAYNLTYITN